jgi:hypothetical protein
VDRLPVTVAPSRAEATLAALRLKRHARCVAYLTSGEVVSGRLHSTTVNGLTLLVDTPSGETRRTIVEQDLHRLGVVVGASKPKRGLIGALTLAALSLPLSVSVPGDMLLPAALVGTLIGRATGDSRIEIVLDRQGTERH